ncbi:Lsr2 family protein [Actinomycetospora corticicola]|uniref:Lsr2 protein n=1 Tax=Actinomycetospora corticicola TaxID=663602 RepID=A0A7Y9J620_9PSEU|nr:Lsr2 family protein [Actinomycetospora corticicola]NYD36775.1 hypothetical protein [Actinomycetospora corticicola]
MSTITILACDLDGVAHTDDDPVTTIEWGLDDALYEIDLCASHELELREVLERYALAGRKAGATAKRAPAPTATAADRPKRIAAAGSDRARNARIREWARAQGMTVPDLGRLASGVVAAYEEAHL